MATFDDDVLVEVGEVPSIRWGWFVGLGAVLSVVGVILLLRPYRAAGTLALLVAIALLIEAVELLFDARYLAKPLFGYVLGALYLITAIVALTWPGITLWALALVAGIGLILSGVTLLVIRRDANRLGVGGIPLWGGILTIAVGVLALAWPGATILVLSIMFGVRVLFVGVALLATGLALRKTV